MGMSLVDETFEVYCQMRKGGKEAKAALEALRMRIELMPLNERTEMVRRVKAWEAQHAGTSMIGRKQSKPVDDFDADFETTGPMPTEVDFAKPPITDFMQPQHSDDQTIACPRCGKPNRVGEVFCASCGIFLRNDSSRHETTRLDEAEIAGNGPDFFGPGSTLVLVVSKDNFSYTIQPQRYKHETVIGRSEGSTMRPDIDLSAHNASKMGVSRLHVALQYNAKNSILSVSDMKSANGTFINGQKLFPQEVRVLRHGDELRLGHLTLRVAFKHPDQSQ